MRDYRDRTDFGFCAITVVLSVGLIGIIYKLNLIIQLLEKLV